MKTAEEILNDNCPIQAEGFIKGSGRLVALVVKSAALKAMEDYANQFREKQEICLREGCNLPVKESYRLCPKHLREAHDKGFDDSNK